MGGGGGGEGRRGEQMEESDSMVESSLKYPDLCSMR